MTPPVTVTMNPCQAKMLPTLWRVAPMARMVDMLSRFSMTRSERVLTMLNRAMTSTIRSIMNVTHFSMAIMRKFSLRCSRRF